MKTSHTALLSQLSLWELPASQESIIDYVETQVRPVSSFSARDPIKFWIPSAKDEYVMLNESELYVKLKITPTVKAGQTPTRETWGEIIPCNNFLHSIFKKVNLIINNHEVSDDSSNYAFKAYFESLLGWSGEAKRSDLSTVLFSMEDAKRKKFMKNAASDDFKSAEFWIGGMLHHDLAFQKKAIIGGTDLMVELIPNNPEFYLEIATGVFTGLTVEFTDIAYYVH